MDEKYDRIDTHYNNKQLFFKTRRVNVKNVLTDIKRAAHTGAVKARKPKVPSESYYLNEEDRSLIQPSEVTN